MCAVNCGIPMMIISAAGIRNTQPCVIDQQSESDKEMATNKPQYTMVSFIYINIYIYIYINI